MLTNRIIWTLILILVSVAGYLTGSTLARADHPGVCGDFLRYPRTFAFSGTLAQGIDPWQLAARDINTAGGVPRDFLRQIDLGSENADIIIMPSSATWVQWFCAGDDSVAIIWVSTSTSYAGVMNFAAHEFVHAFAGKEDHVQHFHEGTKYARVGQYGTRWCDPPYDEWYSPYQGILSYCNGGWWSWDDLAMLVDLWARRH